MKSNIALSESGFVFNPNTGESFTLNPVGQQLFEMIREGQDYQSIRKKFLEIYEVEDSIFEKDYEDFVHLLHSYQMMEPDEQA
ncbi:MAG: PqqD family protein [Bacteroidales bacterium]|nr:PqqD family protein [Bacteroidales bacterium]